MSNLIEKHGWVWVVILDPEKNEQILGQQNTREDITYIPTFLKKEDALQCLNLLVRDKAIKYEIQAIIYEDLTNHARENGFDLNILDGEGNVLEKIQLEKPNQ